MEKKYDGRDLKLESIKIEKHYKGFDGRVRTSCVENIVLEIRGNTMTEPISALSD